MNGNFATILAPVLTVFLVLGIGFTARRRRVLSHEADKTLFRLVVNLFYPCLILDAMVGNPELLRAEVALLAPVICVAIVLVGVGVGRLLAPATGLKFNVERRAFAGAVGLNNYAYFAIPVVIALLPPEALGVCFAYNIGSEICLWTIIAVLITGAGFARSWRKIINAPLLAVLTALVLNLFPTREIVPGFVWSTLHMLGICTVPLGLIMVGSSFADFTVNGMSELLANKRVGMVALLVRSLIMPLFMITVAALSPIPMLLKQVIVVQAAMPASTFTAVMVQHFGGHAPTVLRVILITTAAGLITMPLWIRFGFYCIGAN